MESLNQINKDKLAQMKKMQENAKRMADKLVKAEANQRAKS